jgi:hypothetical protein
MRWAQLWLLKLAQQILQTTGAYAPLDCAMQKALAPKIKWLGRFILALIVLQAGVRAKRAYAQQRKNTGKPYGPKPRDAKHNARRLFGARLRKLRAVKADLRAQITALLTILRDAETHIARFARRLARGLNRRQGGAPRTAFIAQTLAFFAIAPQAANSS